jgi:hypothetical protein
LISLRKIAISGILDLINNIEEVFDPSKIFELIIDKIKNAE